MSSAYLLLLFALNVLVAAVAVPLEGPASLEIQTVSGSLCGFCGEEAQTSQELVE